MTTHQKIGSCDRVQGIRYIEDTCGSHPKLHWELQYISYMEGTFEILQIFSLCILSCTSGTFLPYEYEKHRDEEDNKCMHKFFYIKSD